MKLHDLKPAPGSRTPKRRVGRGIASGQGKTAGRGTKGQKARAGGNLPAWFEGGQTPLHQRIPKLRGFKNPFKIQYEVVNIGAIGALAEAGVFEPGDMPGAKPAKGAKAAPITVNQEILRAAGLVRSLDKPMKILGAGELSTALFVVADAVSGSARSKIEAAGGTVSLLEVPTKPSKAIGVEDDHGHAGEPSASGSAPTADAAEAAADEAPVKAKSRRAPKGAASDAAAASEDAGSDAAEPAEAMASDDAPADEPTEAVAEARTEAAAEPAAEPAEPADDTDDAPAGA